MVNIEVKEFKIKINKEKYTFRLDFRALFKFTNRYENGMELFNEFLQGKNVYECIIKILSCACVEKEWEEIELTNAIPFNFKIMKLMDEITFTLIEGMLQEKEGGEGKNEEASQGTE